eukprot:5575928-Pleurochrysis_carterae.AAC.1
MLYSGPYEKAGTTQSRQSLDGMSVLGIVSLAVTDCGTSRGESRDVVLLECMLVVAADFRSGYKCEGHCESTKKPLKAMENALWGFSLWKLERIAVRHQQSTAKICEGL